MKPRDPLSPARGILIALPLGGAMWAGLAWASPVMAAVGFGAATVGLVGWALWDGGRPLHQEPEPEPPYWAVDGIRIIREGER